MKLLSHTRNNDIATSESPAEQAGLSSVVGKSATGTPRSSS